MKHLHLTHLYSGQCLSHHWVSIQPADDKLYPNDEGYRIHFGQLCIGEVRVVERRTLKVASITQTLAGMVTGYSRDRLLQDMASRNISTEDDATVFLFHFEYIHYYEGWIKAMMQSSLLNQAKNTNNKSFQLSL
jgi:hypothetical protein